jgi:signal peptidase II
VAWKYRVLLIVSFLVVVADQVVKRRIVSFFGGIEGARRVIVPGFFDLVLTHNPGAAWSTFADLKPDGLRVAMFVTISLVASVVVVAFARRARPDQKLLVLALAFVLGGAIGNLVDRVLAGTVVDFLEFYSRAGWMVSVMNCNPTWGCRFPDFNVADSSITVGTILLLATSLFEKGKEPAPPPVDASVLP